MGKVSVVSTGRGICVRSLQTGGTLRVRRSFFRTSQTLRLNPVWMLHNTPVEVTVNGEAAEVLSAVGLPGTVDGYQVNFRMRPMRQKDRQAFR